MSLPGRRQAAMLVSVIDSGRLVVAGLEGVADNHFRFGTIEWTGGVAGGMRADIEASRTVTDGTELQLWLPLEQLPAPGDPLVVSIGCDKSFSTCRSRFANGINFRGCPHMPGSDFAYSYVDGVSVHDGRVLYP